MAQDVLVIAGGFLGDVGDPALATWVLDVGCPAVEDP